MLEALVATVTTILRRLPGVLTVLSVHVDGLDGCEVLDVYAGCPGGVADGYLVVWSDRTARYVPHPDNRVPVALMGTLRAAANLRWRLDSEEDTLRVEALLDAHRCWDAAWRWEMGRSDGYIVASVHKGWRDRAMVRVVGVNEDGSAGHFTRETRPMPAHQAEELAAALNEHVAQVRPRRTVQVARGRKRRRRSA